MLWRDVGNESWQTRVRLASEGVGSEHDASKDRVKLSDVHTTQWIDLEWGGPAFIRQLAATAVVAAIADNFWEECERQRAASMHFLTSNGLINPDPHTTRDEPDPRKFKVGDHR